MQTNKRESLQEHEPLSPGRHRETGARCVSPLVPPFFGYFSVVYQLCLSAWLKVFNGSWATPYPTQRRNSKEDMYLWKLFKDARYNREFSLKLKLLLNNRYFSVSILKSFKGHTRKNICGLSEIQIYLSVILPYKA